MLMYCMYSISHLSVMTSAFVVAQCSDTFIQFALIYRVKARYVAQHISSFGTCRSERLPRRDSDKWRRCVAGTNSATQQLLAASTCCAMVARTEVIHWCYSSARHSSTVTETYHWRHKKRESTEFGMCAVPVDIELHFGHSHQQFPMSCFVQLS